jgi:hypothetical protein
MGSRALPLGILILRSPLDLQCADGLGELVGAPGAAAKLAEDAPGLELGVRALAGRA